jgi:hypothetical protein
MEYNLQKKGRLPLIKMMREETRRRDKVKTIALSVSLTRYS